MQLGCIASNIQGRRYYSEYDYPVLCAFSVPRSSRHIAKNPDPDEGSADNAGGENSIPQVCCA